MRFYLINFLLRPFPPHITAIIHWIIKMINFEQYSGVVISTWNHPNHHLFLRSDSHVILFQLWIKFWKKFITHIQDFCILLKNRQFRRWCQIMDLFCKWRRWQNIFNEVKWTKTCIMYASLHVTFSYYLHN